MDLHNHPFVRIQGVVQKQLYYHKKVQREGPGSLMVLYVRVHGENEENGTAC